MNTDAGVKLALAAMTGFAIGAGGLALATGGALRGPDRALSGSAELSRAASSPAPDAGEAGFQLGPRLAELDRVNRMLADRTAELDALIAALEERRAPDMDASLALAVPEAKPLADFPALDAEIGKIQAVLHATRPIAPEAITVLAAAAAPEATAPARAELTVVLFDSGSATLTIGGQIRVMAAAQMISEAGAARVRIEAHTDTAGPASSNEALAAARAEAVAAVFLAAGLPDERIEIAALGERSAQLPIATPDGVSEPLNRRVAIYSDPADS
jgi:outer membrane protein OmpA-like peptidoglycan-associated protein